MKDEKETIINKDFRLGRTTIEHAIQTIEKIFKENKDKYGYIMFSSNTDYDYDTDELVSRTVDVVGITEETDEEYQRRLEKEMADEEIRENNFNKYQRYNDLKKKFGDIFK